MTYTKTIDQSETELADENHCRRHKGVISVGETT